MGVPVQGKDVELSWVHFDDKQVRENSSAYRTANGGANGVNLPWDYLTPSMFPVDAGSAQEFDAVHGKSEYEYDHVDLMFGQKESDHIATQESNADSNVQTLNHNVSTTVRVIPETDVKMGVNYTHVFNQTWSALVEVGYEVTNYFNALDKGVLGTFDSVNSSSDFAWNGPYARLQLDIA